jgi:hypothetical protein
VNAKENSAVEDKEERSRGRKGLNRLKIARKEVLSAKNQPAVGRTHVSKQYQEKNRIFSGDGVPDMRARVERRAVFFTITVQRRTP